MEASEPIPAQEVSARQTFTTVRSAVWWRLIQVVITKLVITTVPRQDQEKESTHGKWMMYGKPMARCIVEAKEKHG